MLNYKSKNYFQATSLVFIDSHLDNYQFLAQGIINDIEVIILKPTENGLDKITETLQKKVTSQTKIEAIHIFSHGSPGNLQLGNTFLNLDTLTTQEKLIKNWKKALTETANILLYGCNVAANFGGEFVNKISQILEVNIAASIDLTGSKLLGGNWNLGFSTGEIVAKNPLKPEVMANYSSVFATITVTNNNDGGGGSLRQAIADANPGDIIEFDSSLANQTITLTSSQLDINKDLIIDGAIDGVEGPGLTISGNKARRVLETSNRTDVTIRNLIIANGETTESGVAGSGAGIKTGFESRLTVENSTFENNVTSGEGGGAIWAGNKSNTTIINSKFDSNDATAGGSERGGGAISTYGLSVLTIRDSEFTNNKGINGGAINTPSTALTIENSRFINNDTTAGAFTPSGNRGLGGAIYTDGVSASSGGDNGDIIIRDSLFEHNKGAGAGGAAFLFTYPGDNVVVEDTQVLNNSVIFNDQNFAHGGGIRIGTGKSSAGRTTPVQHQITNTTFVGNTAESQGGGLWIQQQPDLIRVNIVNSTFSENRTESADGTVGMGGAITTYSPTTITNTTITNNYAANISGAVHTTESIAPDIEVRNTIFDRNTAGNEFGISQQTHYQLTEGGGNLQFPAVGSDDKLVTANITISDPQLGVLQEVNGLLVHPLLEGSPAIDAGVNTNAPTTDQLGNTRPVDGDNNGSSITDIGAVEFQVSSTPEPTPGDCITGDNLDDLIDGTSDNDCIHGLGGNDTLKGLAGDDTLNGGDGNDNLGGGAGNDQLNGELGNDFLTGWTGDDTLNGGDGFDTLNGGDGFDTLNGGGDADTINGGTGGDLLNGGSGDDLLQGEADDDRLNGDDGNDTVGGGAGNDLVNGNAGNDLISGWLGDDSLFGGADDDTINGGDNNDIIGGGAGNDQLNGDAGNDSLTGWLGDDIIDGGDGFDTLQGGDDADTLNGGNDADTLKGGTGNDLLNGDAGDDFIQGQANDDELNGGDGNDTVGGGDGNDIVNGNAGNDSLTGWWGDDTITGGTGNDIVQGGDGLDILNGEQGIDTLIGGLNSDRFIFDIGSQFNLTDIGADIIKDFNSAELDKIVLSKTTFTSLDSGVGDGFSVAGEFAVVDSDAAVATSSADIVYNSANGQLFYNPNGTTSGFGEGGLFATLENQANLQADDFVLM